MQLKTDSLRGRFAKIVELTFQVFGTEDHSPKRKHPKVQAQAADEVCPLLQSILDCPATPDLTGGAGTLKESPPMGGARGLFGVVKSSPLTSYGSVGVVLRIFERYSEMSWPGGIVTSCCS